MESPIHNDLIRPDAAAGAARAEYQSITPTVGRIVHYGMQVDTPQGSQLHARAALVTEVRPDGLITLRVFMPAGNDQNLVTSYAEPLASGHWSWPQPTQQPASR